MAQMQYTKKQVNGLFKIKVYGKNADGKKIKSFGDFNNWRGFIGLYLTTKEVRQLKKYGITSDTTIRDAYEILCNI